MNGTQGSKGISGSRGGIGDTGDTVRTTSYHVIMYYCCDVNHLRVLLDLLGYVACLASMEQMDPLALM